MKNNAIATTAVFAATLMFAGTVVAAEKMVLPLAPALELAGTRAMLAATPVRFGLPAGQAAGAGAEIRSMSWARPQDTRGYGGKTHQLPDGRPVRLSSEQMCQLALRYSLSNLIDEARQHGGQAVVNVVSNNNDKELNSATTFECIPSNSSSTVNLKGRAASLSEAQK